MVLSIRCAEGETDSPDPRGHTLALVDRCLRRPVGGKNASTHSDQVICGGSCRDRGQNPCWRVKPSKPLVVPSTLEQHARTAPEDRWGPTRLSSLANPWSGTVDEVFGTHRFIGEFSSSRTLAPLDHRRCREHASSGSRDPREVALTEGPFMGSGDMRIELLL